MRIPRSHPRHASLRTRERLIEAVAAGLVVPEGLLAHGRGEAFDYLLGERTIPSARAAERAAAAWLRTGRRPVISVNGNTAVLAGREAVALALALDVPLEVNTFYGNPRARRRLLARRLRELGAPVVLGDRPNARLPGLASARAWCARDGIYTADVVLVPLEDGDRAEALARTGKAVISIDLNPLSRTSLAATVSVVDDVRRAFATIRKEAAGMSDRTAWSVRRRFHNEDNRRRTLAYLSRRLAASAFPGRAGRGSRGVRRSSRTRPRSTP